MDDKEFHVIKEVLEKMVDEMKAQQTGRSSWFRSVHQTLVTIEEWTGPLEAFKKDALKDLLHIIYTGDT